MTKQEFKYVSSVEGRVVARYGSGSFIGVRKVPKKGWVWDTDAVVAIPTQEMLMYGKEYRRAILEGSLKTRTQKDHKAYIESQVAVNEKAAKAREKLAAKNRKAAGLSPDKKTG